jgi:RNA polymerase sigma factor (sigma-70 family)
MAPRTAAAGAAPATTPGGLAGLRGRLRGRSRKPSIERIYRDHHQAIYRYCLAIVRNPADAEDALQATMAAAMRSLPRDRGPSAIRPWLFRVAYNESISIIRARREVPSADPVLGEGSGSAADEAESSDRLRALVADLQALPERQRSALVMRELSGLAYAEIGEALNCGEGAARQVVHEARAALLTRNEGREMECEEARELIDSGDRRRLRSRKLSAHLSACSACADYRTAIDARERDLRALCPPLPIAAAGGILAALTSGGGAGAGAAGGGAVAGGGSAAAGLGSTSAAGGLGSAAAVKGASIAAAAVIAAGAADATGVVELPGTLDRDGGTADTRPSPAAGTRPDTGTAGQGTGAAGRPASSRVGKARAQGELGSSRKGANGKAGGKRRNGVEPPGMSGRSGRNGSGVGPGGGAPGTNGNAGGNGAGVGRGNAAPGANGNAGGNGAGVGRGNAGGNPSPGPPASVPASPQGNPGGGGGSSGAAPTGPPPSSNAGGGGKPAGPGPPAGPPR